MNPTSAVSIRRALLSVSDKTGLVEFARALIERGVEILSTGGTAKLLASNGVPVIEVADYTGFPEMMDGRLKTLHPKIHGGLLGRRGEDEGAMAAHGIPPIDLLVVNLYPFEATVAKPDCALADAIENIDIGGPAMLRAAAKNHAAVTVITDAGDYQRVLDEMQANNGAVSAATRFDLAVKVFEHTGHYDGAIANYLGSDPDGRRARSIPAHLQRAVPQGAGDALRREPASRRGVLRRRSTGGSLHCHRQAASGQGIIL